MGVMLFMVVMVITAVLFTGWVAIMMARWVWRAVVGGSAPARSASHGVLEMQMCSNNRCRATNPMHAQFCRRCGNATGDAAGARRRVAV
jgi:ribosomal protein L40E